MCVSAPVKDCRELFDRLVYEDGFSSGEFHPESFRVLEQCTEDQLLKPAEHYKIAFGNATRLVSLLVTFSEPENPAIFFQYVFDSKII